MSWVDTESVQDIVGAMVAGAGGTYYDATGTITLPDVDTKTMTDAEISAALGG